MQVILFSGYYGCNDQDSTTFTNAYARSARDLPVQVMTILYGIHGIRTIVGGSG